MRFHQAAGVFILLTSLGIALGGGSIPRREDVPRYMQQLKSGNVKDRAKAAEMLGKRGAVNYKDVEGAIEPLKNTLQNDKDAPVRKAAALALGSIKPEPKEVVPLLVTTVKSDANMDVKIAAAESLGLFGPDAPEGAPAIRELMGKFNEKKDRAIRKELQAALQSVTGQKKK